MSNGQQPTAGELFELVMLWLNKLESRVLVSDIKRSIARGVVAQGRVEESKVFRPMNDAEKLSVALESIVSAFDVPFMVGQCKHIFGCDEIVWADELDEPGMAAESTEVNLRIDSEKEYPNVEFDEIESDAKSARELEGGNLLVPDSDLQGEVLRKLVDIIDELQLPIPEIA